MSNNKCNRMDQVYDDNLIEEKQFIIKNRPMIKIEELLVYTPHDISMRCDEKDTRISERVTVGENGELIKSRYKYRDPMTLEIKFRDVGAPFQEKHIKFGNESSSLELLDINETFPLFFSDDVITATADKNGRCRIIVPMWVEWTPKSEDDHYDSYDSRIKHILLEYWPFIDIGNIIVKNQFVEEKFDISTRVSRDGNPFYISKLRVNYQLAEERSDD